MTPEIGDALFDFALALRLEDSDHGAEPDPRAALDLLPARAGLALNAVVAWPAGARAGLLQLLEIWLHVDAIAQAEALPLRYPEGLADRSRASKLGAGMVGWLRSAGPSLATMAGEMDALREGRRRLLGGAPGSPTDARPEAEILWIRRVG